MEVSRRVAVAAVAALGALAACQAPSTSVRATVSAPVPVSLGSLTAVVKLDGATATEPMPLFSSGPSPSLPADLVIAIAASATSVEIDLVGTTTSGLVVDGTATTAVIKNGQAHVDIVLMGPGVVAAEGPDMSVSPPSVDAASAFDLSSNPDADTCALHCQPGETCGNGGCICAATGAPCPPDHTCMPTYCAPNTCEALDYDTAPDEWYTSDADCMAACVSPAICRTKTLCLAHPCPGGQCFRCL